MATKQGKGPDRVVKNGSCPRCEQWAARYHELVKELVAMRRDGFTPSPQAENLPPPPQLDTSIRDALRTNFTIGSAVYGQQEKLAWDMVRSGISPAEVAALIIKGEDMPL